MFLLDKLTSYEGICGNDVDDFFSVLEPVAPAAQHLLILLFLSLMRVTAGTYSAFIYFQF